MKTAAETAPRVQKLGYKGGRMPQLSARVTLVTSGAGVVCHMDPSDNLVFCEFLGANAPLGPASLEGMEGLYV